MLTGTGPGVDKGDNEQQAGACPNVDKCYTGMDSPSAFKVGDVVEAHSLVNAPQLNSLRGTVTQIDGERISVNFGLEHGDKRLRPEKLKNVEASSSPCGVDAAKEAMNIPVDRRLVVKGFTKDMTGAELADFLSGAVLAAAGHADAVRPAAATPCLACAFVPGELEAILGLRTTIGACVSLKLDGLECR